MDLTVIKEFLQVAKMILPLCKRHSYGYENDFTSLYNLSCGCENDFIKF